MRVQARRFAVIAALLLFCAATGFGGGWLAYVVWGGGPLGGAQVPSQPFDNAVTQVVEQVGPSVVKIAARQKVAVDTFFFQGEQEREGIGSGVVISEDGLILTNNHVVENAEAIRVFFSGGRSADADVVGLDPLSDLALLKVSGDGLPAARLGDSDELAVGQYVVAIGNPFRFDNSVTFGVISALGRDISIDPELELDLTDMIQTDASINPGNSGGPLLDMDGRVIGINTAIFQPAQGIGFAIPVNTAKEIISQLQRWGKVPRLGILGGSLTPEIADAFEERFGQPPGATRGAYIVRVLQGTPADRAGLKPGEVVVAVDGRSIETMEELVGIVRRAGLGASLQLTLVSPEGRRRRTVRIT